MKCISAFFISVLLTMSNIPAQDSDFDSLRFEEMKQFFELDESDQPRLIEIMKMTEAQRRLDIRNYHSSSVALYQAAKVRRNRENQLIVQLLNDEQQRRFLREEESPQTTELYMWQEGLRLNAAQMQQVRAIIGDPRRNSGPPEGDADMRQAPDQNQGQPMMGRGPGRRGGMRGPGSEESTDNWVSLQKKKAKSIKTILTKEQLEQFEPLYDMFIRESKKRMEQMQKEREKGRPHPPR